MTDAAPLDATAKDVSIGGAGLAAAAVELGPRMGPASYSLCNNLPRPRMVRQATRRAD